MIAGVQRAVWLVCFSSCVGTAVDLELVSSPAVVLQRLDVRVSPGAGAPLLLDTSFSPDGGLQLPTRLRLLVDDPAIDISAVGFDFEGHARGGSGSAGPLKNGSQTSVRIDLSQTSWCPSAPPEAGTGVIYDEALAAGWQAFGYEGDLTETSGDACTGSHALRYTLTHQFDGLGFKTPTALAVREVSMRVRVDAAQTCRVTVRETDSPTAPSRTLPTPDRCSDADPSQCEIPLVAGWQRVRVSVPSTVTGVLNVQLQLLSTALVQVDVDDVRLVPR